MTEDRLKALEEAWKKSTDGEWQTRFLYRQIRAARLADGLVMGSNEDDDWHDANFTALSHNEMPNLLAEIRRLREELEQEKIYSAMFAHQR